MIKMIVTDLDGTLLGKTRKLTEETKRYFMRLKEQGYIIVIATGRIYTSALKATDGAIFANYIIADTGACIYKQTGETVFQKLIPKELIEKIFRYYNDDFRFIDVCDKNMIYKYSKTEVENNDLVKTVADKNEILENDLEVSHISIAMHTNEAIIELYKKLIIELPELEIIVMQDSFKDNKWIEMTVKDCYKYNAIKTLADYLGIKNDEVIAFGDGLNDIDMIKNCGIGVALQNALPEVKEVANDVTFLTNEQDGIIHYLQDILKEAD